MKTTIKNLVCGGLLLAAGCNSQPPVAMAYLDDPTDSCQDGHADFQRYWTAVLQSGLPRHSQVLVVHDCVEGHVLFAGQSSHGQEIQAAVERAARPCPCRTEPDEHYCGTDHVTALELAKTWLARAEFSNYRKLLVAYTDFIADPCKVNGVRTFQDPTTFDWQPVQVEAHLYGISPGRFAQFRKAPGWATLQPAPCGHFRFEMVEADHLGLSSSAF